MSVNYRDYFIRRNITWGIIALAVIILAVASLSTYNGLAAANQDVQGRWSEVENEMQRRADVILNEVEVVKAYAKHEEKVFGDIAAARAVLYSGTSGIEEKLAANDQIGASARSLLVLAENYPELKAGEQFSNLQTTIEGSENRVAVARKYFIESVQKYNTKVTRFPGVIFARLMGFDTKDYFTADPEAQKSPEVKFD